VIEHMFARTFWSQMLPRIDPRNIDISSRDAMLNVK